VPRALVCPSPVRASSLLPSVIAIVAPSSDSLLNLLPTIGSQENPDPNPTLTREEILKKEDTALEPFWSGDEGMIKAGTARMGRLKAFLDRLEEQKLLFLWVAGDGNCLFAAFSLALYSACRHHLLLRRVFIAEIEANPKEYMEHGLFEWNKPVDRAEEEDEGEWQKRRWEGFLAEMSKENTWGGSTAIKALCKVLHVRCRVLTDIMVDIDTNLVHEFGEKGDKIVLAFQNDNHYSVCSDHNGTTIFKDPPQPSQALEVEEAGEKEESWGAAGGGGDDSPPSRTGQTLPLARPTVLSWDNWDAFCSLFRTPTMPLAPAGQYRQPWPSDHPKSWIPRNVYSDGIKNPPSPSIPRRKVDLPCTTYTLEMCEAEAALLLASVRGRAGWAGIRRAGIRRAGIRRARIRRAEWLVWRVGLENVDDGGL
jgi:hypothetical protein